VCLPEALVDFLVDKEDSPAVNVGRVTEQPEENHGHEHHHHLHLREPEVRSQLYIVFALAVFKYSIRSIISNKVMVLVVFFFSNIVTDLDCSNGIIVRVFSIGLLEH